MLKQYAFILIFLTIGFRSIAAEYDLYLLAGQSNMDGRGNAENLSEIQRSPSSTAIIFYRNPPYTSDGWKPLSPGFSIPPGHKSGIPSFKFGPELGFVETMNKAQSNRRLALIKGSKGGTSLRKDWQPGVKGDADSQGPIYQNFIDTVRIAMRQLTEDGHTFKLRGLLWHQGESDSKSSTEMHYQRLVKFAGRIREDLEDPELPIVVGEVFDNGQRDSVLSAIRLLSENDSTCELVSAEGTTTWDAGTHFDAKSQLLLGQRYAEAMLKLIQP